MVNKKNSVNLLASNTAGAINETGIRYLKKMDAMARRPGAHDDTDYDTDHRSTISFFTHHLRSIGVACIRAQATVIRALASAATKTVLRAERKTGVWPV